MANAIHSTATSVQLTRIVILGGGFGGLYTARHLEKRCRRRKDVEIVLVSRDNFLLMTPLLFEICSGTLDSRHCAFPIRAFLRRTRFVEATVTGIDLDRKVVHLAGGSESGELAYDQIVLALGAMTNRVMIPGSEHAFTFKTLADALLLRNHIIERFERADVETDAELKRRQLTFVIIGGGLVGVELFGELTAFADGIAPLYKRVNRDEVRFVLLQAGERIMPEMNPKLAEYGSRSAWPTSRRGNPNQCRLSEQSNAARFICRTKQSKRKPSFSPPGSSPTRLWPACPWRRTSAGTLSSMGRCAVRAARKLWAIGDCASIPAPDGKPYPNLAQHALREAKVLARNINGVLNGELPKPFVFDTLGMMGSLGHGKAFGQLLKVRVHGVLAWFVRRTYYLLQMPGWGRRFRIMIDWTFALLFRPDVVRINLDSEVASILREANEDTLPAADRGHGDIGSSEESQHSKTKMSAAVVRE